MNGIFAEGFKGLKAFAESTLSREVQLELSRKGNKPLNPSLSKEEAIHE